MFIKKNWTNTKRHVPLKLYIVAKYYGCTETFVRKDVENHECLELLNHSKLILRLPDNLSNIAIRNSGHHDNSDIIVLSKMIATLKFHLTLLLLLASYRGLRCILHYNYWLGEHFTSYFTAPKTSISSM